MATKERLFEIKFLKALEREFPGCILLKNYPEYLQGFPDRLMLFEDRWAAFELKHGIYAPVQPNQKYYVDLLNRMSYASFVFPENAERVLDEIQQTFRTRGTTRFPIRE